MSEPSYDLRTVFANYRVICQVCTELGVSISDVEAALAQDAPLTPSTDATAVRVDVCRTININHLHQAARQSKMPAAVLLDLQRSIESMGTTGTSYRDLRVYSVEELVQRAALGGQGNLFDEDETPPTKSSIEWDDDAYPRG